MKVEWLNSLVDAANGAVVTVDPTSGLEMSRTSAGTTIRNATSGTRMSTIAKSGGSTIPATSGTTVGSGTVTLYKMVGTTLTSMVKTVTAYNLSTHTVAASTFLMLMMVDGRWMIVWENCP